MLGILLDIAGGLFILSCVVCGWAYHTVKKRDKRAHAESTRTMNMNTNKPQGFENMSVSKRLEILADQNQRLINSFLALNEKYRRVCDELASYKAGTRPRAETKRTHNFAGLPFSDEEIKFILTRVHPDYNSNSDISNEVTKKVNQMRRN